jgi:tetratricopeptide (TPR) repeat protein
VLEAALAFEPHDSASRASLLALLAVEFSSAGDEMLERRLALADEAVAVARRVGEPATLARVLDAGVFSTWIPERLDNRLAWAEEAVQFSDTVDDPALDYWVSSRRKVLALETQDRPTYETYRQRQVALAARLGQPVMRWHTTYFEGTRAFLNGDLEGAEALASEALELGFSSGQPDALSYYGAQLVTIRILQGRLGELEDLIRQQAEANPGIPSFRVALASLCADEGRHDEAIEMLEDDVANGFSRFAKDPMWFVNLTGAARVAAVVSQTGTSARAVVLANALHDVLAPWSDRVIHIEVIARPPIAHSLGQLDGVLGRDDDADDHFATALEIASRIQAPLFAAMTRVEWGALRLERGRGDPDVARALVSEGLETAVAAGAGGIERRAREAIERFF